MPRNILYQIQKAENENEQVHWIDISWVMNILIENAGRDIKA